MFSNLVGRIIKIKEKRTQITRGEIEEIFAEVCRQSNKTEAILNQGGIDLTIFKITKEKTIFDQASAAMYEIAVNQFFSDGNKRTAIILTELILNKGGYKLKVENPEQTKNTVIKIARKKKDVKEIKEWIKKHAVKL
jgi:death-on-curing protein